MREENMDDIQDLDAVAEADGRRLLTMAFETGPAGDGLAGADLLRRVRRRTSRRRRVRTLVPAGAVAALGGAAALGVTLTATVASAPSAFAAVTAAAAKTSAESFSVTATEIHVFQGFPGASRDGKSTITGVFDPGHGLGEYITNGEARNLFVGGHEYLKDPTDGKAWQEFLTLPPLPPPSSSAVPAVGGSEIADGFDGDEPIDPGALLGLLKSVGSVQAEGPASGPGWTGTEYAFTVPVPGGFRTAPSGTVYVDNQGRVRRLVTTNTTRFLRLGNGKGSLTVTYDMTFANFGVRVSVTAPPASQVYNHGNEGLTMLLW
jgi:hypothetical protein